MDNILVNALSVTNQSGLNVLAGHLGRLVAQLRDRCVFAVLIRDDMQSLKHLLDGQVEWITAPASTARWMPRVLWELLHLSGIAHRAGSRFYFTPSGIAAPFLRTPQVVFCQNPWAFVPAARRTRDAVKAWLQRLAYRRTVKTAAVMVFNSEFMREAYRANAGRKERNGLVVYQAANDDTRHRAELWRDRPRSPGQILCVSAMGPHKNAEALVQAFQLVRNRPGAMLHFTGSWPDPEYERKIRTLVRSAGLDDQVSFAGFVTREELDRLYAESMVFCLMTRCESFGIPAVEAQLFGTPVVSSNACAVPEICGDGGVFLDPDDVPGIAAALDRLLTDGDEWKRISTLARVNAVKYNWENCSQPLVGLFAAMLPDCGVAREIPLSAVILCRNEAVNLDRCIAALRGVAEVVVVDDGSTDGSRDLARSLGARVVEHRFVSFADQRNWAMDHAGLAYDWVLHLDADEVMTPAALDEIRRRLPGLGPRQTGFIARKMMLDGRWLRFSADYPVYVPRLIHRNGQRFVMRGHGEIIEGDQGNGSSQATNEAMGSFFLAEPLLHYVFSKGWPDWWGRHRRYAQAEAVRISGGLPVFSLRRLLSKDRTVRRGVIRALSYRLPGRPALRFFYAYILRIGFLDGYPGFRFCRAMARYERMINDELKALQEANSPCTSP